jgi:hypothetical protein
LLAFQLQPTARKSNGSFTPNTTVAFRIASDMHGTSGASATSGTQLDTPSLPLSAQSDCGSLPPFATVKSNVSPLSREEHQSIWSRANRTVRRLTKRWRKFRSVYATNARQSNEFESTSGAPSTDLPPTFTSLNSIEFASALPSQTNPLFESHPRSPYSKDFGLDSASHTLPGRKSFARSAVDSFAAGEPLHLASPTSNSIGHLRVQRLQQQRHHLQQRYLQLLRLDAQNLSIKSDSRLVIGRKQQMRQQFVQHQFDAKLAARCRRLPLHGNTSDDTQSPGTLPGNRSPTPAAFDADRTSPIANHRSQLPNDTRPETQSIDILLVTSAVRDSYPARTLETLRKCENSSNKLTSGRLLCSRSPSFELTSSSSSPSTSILHAELRPVSDVESENDPERNAENTYFYCNATFASLPAHDLSIGTASQSEHSQIAGNSESRLISSTAQQFLSRTLHDS